MIVYVKARSRVYHRDPGCSRLFVNGAGRTEPEAMPSVRSFGRGLRPCAYCHSAAGYRRYPRPAS